MPSNWDAHLAWSGGVESTAILAWAIKTGHKVKVFHAYPHWDNNDGDGMHKPPESDLWKK